MTSEQKGLTALGGIVSIAAAFFVAKRLRGRGDAAPREWTCACGQAYYVQGLDRHRVYTVVEGDPVLGRDCVSCGEPLPTGHDAPA